jgi:hypothetical protein
MAGGFKMQAPVVDAVTFAEDPTFLARKLYPMQREILTEFFNPQKNYEELLLVCGRDSGKTFLVSIIASYLAYLWLAIPDPYSLFEQRVDRDKEVSIICIAVKQEQATVLLDEIKAKINSSPFFADKVVSQNSQEIVLQKSLHIVAATSNSASEVGRTAIAVLFDEAGRFGEESGTRDGEEVYDSMTPSVGRFASNRGAFIERCGGDRDLEHIVRCLGRIASISTPMGKQGILWRLYNSAQRLPATFLLYQKPTWEMNPNYPPGCPYLENEKAKNPRTFMREFGAQFDEALDAMFPPELVERCAGGFAAYDHLQEYHGAMDTSRKKDAFAFAVGHLQGGRVIIDVIRYFIPKDGKLDWDQVEHEIRRLCREYRVEDLLHDGYEAEGVRLHFHDFLLEETPFTGPYKMQIYASLEDRMHQGQIQYPRDERLIRELKALQKKWNGDKFTIHHPESGPVTTDDGPDVVANLTFNLFERLVTTREGIDDERISREWPEDHAPSDRFPPMIWPGQDHLDLEGDSPERW